MPEARLARTREAYRAFERTVTYFPAWPERTREPDPLALRERTIHDLGRRGFVAIEREIVRCPRCAHACGNVVDVERQITVSCQYCGYKEGETLTPLDT